MKIILFILFSFLYINISKCHLFIVDNEIKIENFLYGGEKLDKLQIPLQEINGKGNDLKSIEQWMCHGYKNNSNKEIKNMIIGKSYKFNIGCASGSRKNNYQCKNDYSNFHLEKDEKPRGCILSVAKKVGVNNFKVIAIDKECPKPEKSSFDITLDKKTQECINCVCAWTWIPSIKFSGSEVRGKDVVQSYMNCFNCNIIKNKKSNINETSKNKYRNKQLLFYNLPGGEYTKEDKEVDIYYK